MSPPTPTSDQLAAMAYVDGELAPQACRELEARLASSPMLAREVAELQRLAVLARLAAPPEPMDSEWQRIRLDPLQRAALPLGWLTFGLGLAGLALVSLWLFLSDPAVPSALRWLGGLAALGLGVLFASVLRNRLRTLPFDPYRDVER